MWKNLCTTFAFLKNHLTRGLSNVRVTPSLSLSLPFSPSLSYPSIWIELTTVYHLIYFSSSLMERDCAMRSRTIESGNPKLLNRLFELKFEQTWNKMNGREKFAWMSIIKSIHCIWLHFESMEKCQKSLMKWKIDLLIDFVMSFWNDAVIGIRFFNLSSIFG